MRRILVFGMTNSLAGTEAAISNLVSLAPKDCRFDYLTFEELDNWPGVTRCGGKVIILPNKREEYLEYRKAIRAYFREHSYEYEAVWVNLNILNNIDALKLGYRYGINRRILHAHNSRPDGKLHQRLLCAMNRPVFERYVTERWACSQQAGQFFFNKREFRLVPNAIRMDDYQFNLEARVRIRKELRIEGCHVIGTIGRLAYQKNQEMLVRMLPLVLEINPRARLVIVGEGELDRELRALAEQLGVANQAIFTGRRSDIPDILSSFDVFAFPSRFEGFGIVLLEAQANGLPCVISDSIPDDPIISDGCLVVNVNNQSEWITALLSASRDHTRLIPKKAQLFDLACQSESLEGLFR